MSTAHVRHADGSMCSSCARVREMGYALMWHLLDRGPLTSRELACLALQDARALGAAKGEFGHAVSLLTAGLFIFRASDNRIALTPRGVDDAKREREARARS